MLDVCVRCLSSFPAVSSSSLRDDTPFVTNYVTERKCRSLLFGWNFWASSLLRAREGHGLRFERRATTATSGRQRIKLWREGEINFAGFGFVLIIGPFVSQIWIGTKFLIIMRWILSGNMRWILSGKEAQNQLATAVFGNGEESTIENSILWQWFRLDCRDSIL